MDRKLLGFLTSFVMLMLAACAGGSPGYAPQDLEQASVVKSSLSHGKPFGDVHELHAGPDENGDRYAECLDCHASHGMIFDWQNVDREYCLACHTDMTNHHKNQDCMKCHNTSGGPGGK